MAGDDEATRRERADRLRRQIDEKIGSTPAREEKPRPESPRDFVERRMRETDKKGNPPK
jgi:hypothetical protein